jgi:hypothetical protein
LISQVADAVMADAREWQQRPPGDVYPVLLLDASVVNIREAGLVQCRGCCLALDAFAEMRCPVQVITSPFTSSSPMDPNPRPDESLLAPISNSESASPD